MPRLEPQGAAILPSSRTRGGIEVLSLSGGALMCLVLSVVDRALNCYLSL